ncbi:MAG: NFYB/HAP3 family transcription factor subunit [Nanoarchaeota archaeon]|nr:NFYB/HAP3 family transcription factor subunit [Nanoarchaeota archaeon]
MGRNTQTIPKAVAARILMNAGAKRVSSDAAQAFADEIEKMALEIGSTSAKVSKHAGRKTVTDEDIKMVIK